MKRRDFLKTGGALVISFSIPLQSAFGQPKPDPRFLTAGAWLEIAPDGRVTFYTGKVELGTGVETALAQLVAEELEVDLGTIKMVMGDTERCPDQIGTFGSLTIFLAGPQVRQAAAEARLALLDLASTKLNLAVENLRTENGAVIAPDGKRISYGELVQGKRLERPLSNKAKLKDPAQFKVVGKSAQRLELPAKVYGTHTYIQNVRIPGLFHGRVIRPPVHGAAPVHIDDSALKKLPGHPQVVQQGNFLAVVADREEQVIRAAQALRVEWGAAPLWPQPQELPQVLKRTHYTDKAVDSGGELGKGFSQASKTHTAQYYVPYQLHASIGPSCAIADVKADRATLWSPTQTSFLTRDSVAAILKLPPSRVRLIWVEGSGCYGQNGADDVTGDAALLSQLIGQPVRVQWMRRDEHCCEPKGPPMVMEVKGGLDAQGNVVAWDYEVWSPNHAGRPFGGMGGNLLAGEELGLPQRFIEAGADRNAKNSYVFVNKRVVLHQLAGTPLRSSSLRGLGSPQNTFANESFVDELAALAGADPIEFRIRHLKDERAIAVLREVAKMSSWQPRTGPSRSGVGKGVAYAQYDNYSAYAAVAVQVRVDPAGKTRVEKAWVAHDCGMIVNPDGVKLQIEGNIIQTVSRALLEEVRFNRRGLESIDWASYPILRFSEVPDEIAISLIDRPNLRAVGAGEPAASPVFAAVANAIYDATGVRLRNVPFTPERLKLAQQAGSGSRTRPHADWRLVLRFLLRLLLLGFRLLLLRGGARGRIAGRLLLGLLRLRLGDALGRRAGGGGRSLAAYAQRGEGALIELPGSLQTLRLLERFHRGLGFGSQLAVGLARVMALGAQLLLRLLDELGVLAHLRRLRLTALLLSLRALRLRLLLRLICRDGGEGHGCCGCNDEMTYLHTNSFSNERWLQRDPKLARHVPYMHSGFDPTSSNHSAGWRGRNRSRPRGQVREPDPMGSSGSPGAP